jgi:hypothetical protein
MLYQNHVFIKNGYQQIYWDLLINMATIIVIVSSEGDMFKVQFNDSVLQLISTATQMTITTDALGFYLPANTMELYEFMSKHMIHHALVNGNSQYSVGANQIALNDDIRNILTDKVNIDMFHMMSNCMMDIDAETCDIDIDMSIDDMNDIDKFIDSILVDTMVM